jgi:hypothetical protein
VERAQNGAVEVRRVAGSVQLTEDMSVHVECPIENKRTLQ